MSSAQPTPATRLFFADWLRIGAFGLLVLYHVGMLYVPWAFHVKQLPTYAALEPWMRLTNPWRMSLLFMVSGLATGLMLGRDGLLRQRTRRLMLPLLLGVAVIVPPQAWLQVREQFGYTGGYLEFLLRYYSADQGFCRNGHCLVLPTWNHLWFLPYLWCYTALLLAAWRWWPTASRQRAANALAQPRGTALLLVPIIVLGATRALLLPRFGVTHALVDDPWAHATYGPLFAVGVLLGRRQRLLMAFEALRWPALALALLAWAVQAFAPPTEGAARVALRFVVATQQWGALVAAFGFAHRHLNRDHRWRAPLTEAVFPLYLVHQTIIIIAAVALRPWALPAAWEALVLVVLTAAGGLLAWQVACRLPPLRVWLGLSPAPRAAGGTG
jgi:glucans biosynthesis protein C